MSLKVVDRGLFSHIRQPSERKRKVTSVCRETPFELKFSIFEVLDVFGKFCSALVGGAEKEGPLGHFRAQSPFAIWSGLRVVVLTSLNQPYPFPTCNPRPK